MSTPTSNIFAFRMPAGIPGRPNREQAHTGEPNILDATSPPGLYGDFCKMGSNGRIQALVAGDAGTAIYGNLEGAYPIQAVVSYLSQGYGSAAPAPGTGCTVMRRGYMLVNVQGATVPSKGGPVYIRLAGTIPTGGRLNGIEAAADSTNTILVPNCTFMGAPDSYGNCEIAYNI